MSDKRNHTTLYFNHHTQIVVSEDVEMVKMALDNSTNQFIRFTETTDGVVMKQIFINKREILYFRKHSYEF